MTLQFLFIFSFSKIKNIYIFKVISTSIMGLKLNNPLIMCHSLH